MNELDAIHLNFPDEIQRCNTCYAGEAFAPIEIIGDIFLLRDERYFDLLLISKKIKSIVELRVAEKLLTLPITKSDYHETPCSILTIRSGGPKLRPNTCFKITIEKYKIIDLKFDYKQVFSKLELENHKQSVTFDILGLISMKNILMNRARLLGLSNYCIVDEIIKSNFLFHIANMKQVFLLYYFRTILNEINIEQNIQDVQIIENVQDIGNVQNLHNILNIQHVQHVQDVQELLNFMQPGRINNSNEVKDPEKLKSNILTYFNINSAKIYDEKYVIRFKR